VSRWVLDVLVLRQVLDERRRAAGLTWRDLAAEVDVSPNVFSRMRRGGVPDAHALGSLLMWLGWAPELALLVRESASAGEQR
jgi:transcriptional regulator with XRE-family HTH domain